MQPVARRLDQGSGETSDADATSAYSAAPQGSRPVCACVRACVRVCERERERGREGERERERENKSACARTRRHTHVQFSGLFLGQESIHCRTHPRAHTCARTSNRCQHTPSLVHTCFKKKNPGAIGQSAALRGWVARVVPAHARCVGLVSFGLSARGKC